MGTGKNREREKWWGMREERAERIPLVPALRQGAPERRRSPEGREP